MGYIGNQSRALAFTGRQFAGSKSQLPASVSSAGAWRAFCSQDGASTYLAGAAWPVGYYAPSAYYMPQIDSEMSLNIGGAGTITSGLIPSLSMVVALSGTGTISADCSLAVAMLCAMSGTGSLSPLIEGRLNASIDMTGSGSMTNNIQALGSMALQLFGSGQLNAGIQALGNMKVDIVVTGSGLTAGAISSAVWLTEMDSGFSAAECMQIFSAILAGKTTIVDLGGGAATVTFRSLDDTVDRATFDMQDSERINRIDN